MLREFVGAFATPEHPLAIFLDDLQWVDPASLKLVVDLLTHPNTRHMLFVGAYRDSEVDPAHPLVRALDEVRNEGAPIHTLLLGPLAKADLSELVADTLHCSPEEAEPLARLVRDKTAGNPFFVIQFLTALHRQGLIAFDRDARAWRWDLARIRAQGYTDNVIELVVGKLHDLPPETQEALALAACLGATMNADALAVVFGRDPDVALRAALEEDLLFQMGDAYRFPHDRVQEAAYSLIPEVDRATVHLRIGRLLLEHTSPHELEDEIFDVVNQLNLGAALVTLREERDRIAELNLMAGRRAQRSTAYASALRYFVAGAEILEDDRWARRYDLAFPLELHRAACELWTRDVDTAELRLVALADRAANDVDAAAVACLLADLYTTSGQSPRAVDACLAYLRRVGFDWSPHPDDRGGAGRIRPDLAAPGRPSDRGPGRCAIDDGSQVARDDGRPHDPVGARFIHRREPVLPRGRPRRQPQPGTRHQRRFVPGLRSPRRDPGDELRELRSGVPFRQDGFRSAWRRAGRCATRRRSTSASRRWSTAGPSISEAASSCSAARSRWPCRPATSRPRPTRATP